MTRDDASTRHWDPMNRPLNKAQAERRCKLIYICPQLMTSLLGFDSVNGKRQYSISSEGLPDGYELGRIAFIYERDAFAIQVFHESFDPVDPALVVPELSIKLTAHSIEHHE